MGDHGPPPAKPRPKTVADIRNIYADQAIWMARFDWTNRLVTGRYRRRLFRQAEGRVLDVACGTGMNVRYIPISAEYIGIDASPEMLDQARTRMHRLGRQGVLSEMDAQALAFHENRFDTVISALSTCTFPDPMAALAEMARVCADDGRILLLEHGRSDLGPIARAQDWWADAHYEKHGCRWNQEPLDIVRSTGLTVQDSTTALAGIVTMIEATPH